jgi:anaerobic magnesium-protoporphyrin IX monomethyl ester cyclase
VLLVDPYCAREDPMERKFVELYPSLSLLTLGGYLRERGVRVEIVDLTFARDERPVRASLRNLNPQVVGVHTKTLTVARSLGLVEQIHAAGALAVAGGPDSASRPALYLDGGFDAVALGEGELTLTEVAQRAAGRVPLRGTPGLVTRRSDGTPEVGPHRPFLANLDDLPLPAWDLIDMERYLREWQSRTGERRAALVTSRGCPFDCSWCSKPTFGRTYRLQSADRVLRELEALQQTYRVDYVRFCDDVFGVQRRWMTRLLEGMIDRVPGMHFECLARVDLLKPELLDPMRRAGLERVYLGVESGSQKMLDLMNRGTHIAQIRRVSTELRQHGIRQFWFLMLGYPGETMEDIEGTLRLFREFSPEEYSVSIAVPVPGTRLFDLVKERLRGTGRTGRKAGGSTLLYEAAYPESLYRWEQARFAWEARLQRLRGRLDPEVLRQLSSAVDEFHARVATPLLLGPSTASPVERGPGRLRRLALPLADRVRRGPPRSGTAPSGPS